MELVTVGHFVEYIQIALVVHFFKEHGSRLLPRWMMCCAKPQILKRGLRAIFIHLHVNCFCFNE